MRLHIPPHLVKRSNRHLQDLKPRDGAYDGGGSRSGVHSRCTSIYRAKKMRRVTTAECPADDVICEGVSKGFSVAAVLGKFSLHGSLYQNPVRVLPRRPLGVVSSALLLFLLAQLFRFRFSLLTGDDGGMGTIAVRNGMQVIEGDSPCGNVPSPLSHSRCIRNPVWLLPLTLVRSSGCCYTRVIRKSNTINVKTTPRKNKIAPIHLIVYL